MQCNRVEKLGPYDSQAATNWSLELGQADAVKEVTIRLGYIVDGIGFTTADGCGKTTKTYFGGQGGYGSHLVLKPHEHITQISGTTAEYEYAGRNRLVSSLKIHTNLKPEGYGPYGAQKGCRNTQCFSTPMPLNGTFAGFFGRAETYLESLGFYINKQDVQKFGPYGSQLSTNYDLQLRECESFKEVTIRSGWIVDGIGFGVADRCGKITNHYYGGPGGDEHKIQLKANEYITQISGTHGVYGNGQREIATIRIHTNLCHAGHGPFGEGKGVREVCCFFSTPPGGTIVGFFGRATQYLDSVGVYLKKLDYGC